MSRPVSGPPAGRDRGASPFRPGHPAYAWIVLLATSIGIVMPVLDTTIVNVAIARLQLSFGASTEAVQWVITAYLLVYAVILAVSGWMADRFGYRTVFLGALALFTAGSFLCSVSWSLGTLILSRVVQGAGGGMIMPVSMAIVTREIPKEKLGTAIAIWSIPALASTSFGPTLGGWLIDRFSWQAMFDINVPIGILAFAACSIVLREHKSEEHGSFDLLGVASLSVALASLLLALADGNAAWNTDGWRSSFILTCLALSAGGFALFFICEFTTDQPVIDFSLLKIYNFGMSAAVLFVFGLGIFGSDFLLPLYLQEGLGYTPTQAGMVFIPNGIIMILSMAIGGRLTDRIGAKVPGLIGIILRAVGMYRFTFLTPDSGGGDILSTVCLLGAGMGFLASPLQTVAIGSIPQAKMAQGSGLIKIVQQIGGSFGVALLSTILVNRERFHMARVGEVMSPSSPFFDRVLSRAAMHALHATGGTMSDAANKAGTIILSHVQAQTFAWSIDDVFFVAMLMSVVSSIPFLFLRTGRGRKERGAAAGAPMPAMEDRGVS